MYLPGCPPRPEMLIDAILRLHEKIMHEPLGDKRRLQLEAKRERDGAPLVEPGEMPSSYRFDKQRKAEWLKAAAQGREEQLRIEKWMEERARLAATAPPRNGGSR
jgi:NADH-quinone oxidoreductase subunit B